VRTARLTAALFFVSVWVLMLLGLVTQVPLLAALLLLSGTIDGAIRTLHQRLIMEYCEPGTALACAGVESGGAQPRHGRAGVAGGVLAQTDFRWVFFGSAAMTLLALLWFVRTTWQRPVLDQ
jgi:hypothetical protein